MNQRLTEELCLNMCFEKRLSFEYPLPRVWSFQDCLAGLNTINLVLIRDKTTLLSLDKQSETIWKRENAYCDLSSGRLGFSGFPCPPETTTEGARSW